MLDSGGGGAEGSGDVAGGDVVGLAAGIEVAVQRAVWRRQVVSEVEDSALGRVDGAESGVARAAVSEGFAAGCVLLVSVGETNVSPSLHVMRRAVGGRSPLDGGAAEGGIAEAERCAAAAVGGGGEGIFPGRQRK